MEDAVYEGEWTNGLRHGKGKIIFTKTDLDKQYISEYEGYYIKGFKQGYGKYLYPSGNYYEGEWKYDKKEGYGTMYWNTVKEKYYGVNINLFK